MTRCPLCPGLNPIVPSCGSYDSGCFFVGESPYKDETKKLTPFVGRTGQEVNQHYLPLAGLTRGVVVFSNAISCMPSTASGKLDPNRAKDLELLESCANHHLYPEIEAARPKVIIPMGSFACRAIDPDIDMELHHGIPLNTGFGLVLPMYHPALGMYEPKKMLMLRNDWIRLKKLLNNTLTIPEDEYPDPDYQELTTTQELDDYLEGMEDYPMGNDTETMRGGVPFCLTISVRKGTGRLIRAENKELLERFQFWLDRWRNSLLWHNWLFDIKVVTAMGLRYPRKLIVDTMVKVFHLGNLPQGLKPLAFRELGMKMQDFDDVVRPHSKILALQYLRECALEEWDKPESELVREKDGNYKLKNPQSFKTRVKRFFTDWAKNPNKDPFDMWDNNWESDHEMIQERMGTWPGICISHAPFDNVLRYAVRDADSLLRLWPVVQHRISRMRKVSQDRWSE